MNINGQPGHRTTTAHIQAAYPFVAEGGLGGRGVYIGRDVYGGSFCYDPWELYGKELTSPNAVVIGIVGRAKSSLVKTYVLRQRSEEHTSELQSPCNLVCRLLLA